MNGKYTVKSLQEYISKKDCNKDAPADYFYKLAEELGEVGAAMRKGKRFDGENIKGTLEEELWDVMYYVLALANVHDIDLEKIIPIKEEINRKKYNSGVFLSDYENK